MRREVKFGLCIPAVCNKTESLRFLDNVYKQFLILSKSITYPDRPVYRFPKDQREELWANISFSFFASIGVIIGLVTLSILG